MNHQNTKSKPVYANADQSQGFRYQGQGSFALDHVSSSKNHSSKTQSRVYNDQDQVLKGQNRIAQDGASINNQNQDACPFVCSDCNKGYHTPRGLELHIEVIHKGKSVTCPVCDIKLSQKSSINRHLKMKHQSRLCPVCEIVFKLGPEFERHVLKCKYN